MKQHKGEREDCEGSRTDHLIQSLHIHLGLPLGLALGSPIFPSGCEGKLGVALESLQGRRDLTSLSHIAVTLFTIRTTRGAQLEMQMTPPLWQKVKRS